MITEEKKKRGAKKKYEIISERNASCKIYVYVWSKTKTKYINQKNVILYQWQKTKIRTFFEKKNKKIKKEKRKGT